MGESTLRVLRVLPVALMFVVLGVVVYYLFSPAITTLRFSTGSDLGLYNQLGQDLKTLIEEEHDDIKIEILSSSGSGENVSRIDEQMADLAMVQNDATGGKQVKSVAAIYPEVLHLICRADAQIENLEDLSEKKINVGSRGSGTEQIASALLEFIEYKGDEGHVSHLGFSESLGALGSGSIDAAFFLTGLGAEIIPEALSRGEMKLASISISPSSGGSSQRAIQLAEDFGNGFRVHYPHVHPATIPIMAYDGVPRQPVPAVSVDAVLVCNEKLSDDIVNRITKTLFEKRAVLSQMNSAFSHLDEEKAQLQLQFPLHEGAESFYRRSEPGFLVENAEAMGFVLTIMLLAWSVFVWLQKIYSQKKKNRIDRFYKRIDQVNQKLTGITTMKMCVECQDLLNQIRSEASKELVDERIAADDAFLIYQNMLNGSQNALGRIRSRFQ